MTPAARRWLLIFRVPLTLLGIFLFFALYNRFLLDKNLQSLRTSFSVMDGASGVGQAEAALLLVDQTLTDQMAQEDFDLHGAVTLQFARGALASDHLDRPPDDAQVLVQILSEDKAADRPAVLASLDGMISSVQNATREAALLPRQALSKPLSPEIDTARLQEAAVLEKRGRFPEAVSLYEQVLREYPDYSGRASLKMRLGHLSQKMNDSGRARKLYQEALAEARDPKETEISRKLLDQLAGSDARTAQSKNLEKKLAGVGSGPDRQRIAFKLGSMLLSIPALDQAAKTFREAFLADPEGDLAAPALFKEAWCLSASGRVEDALSRFGDLLRQYPKTEWAAASYLQIAEIYRAAGDPAAAASACEHGAAAQTKDAALAAIAYAEAGCIYQFDLNDTGKAQVLFRDLAKRFPASSFSSIGRRLEELRIRKGRLADPEGPGISAPTGAPPLPRASGDMFAAGSPLINWLENFLPVFVSVFTDRLSKYMQAVGETELARRFTDAEFGELVVREVQRRFPGQVTDVKTQIHPEGFIGSGNVHLALFSFSVETHIGIEVKNFRPHAILRALKVGKFSLPDSLLKLLETRINASIDRKNYPLKIREYKLNEGYAWISVEVAQ